MEYEIIIVDNASKDGSIEMIQENYINKFKQVKLILNNQNLGFSKANNIGIKQANGRYILLLNSDTVVKQSSINKCIEFADNNEDIGVVGCKIVLKDGRLDVACKRAFPTPINSLYHALNLDKLFPKNKKIAAYNLTYIDENQVSNVECIMGAFMLVKKEVIQQVGMLDERFFMYGEDIDWCYRIKNAGWQIYYYPKAEIVHYKKASGKRSFKVIYQFYNAMLLFYKKHYIGNYNVLVTLLVYIGVYALLGLAFTKNLFKSR
jgi:GT2 family glycosyltransferase